MAVDTTPCDYVSQGSCPYLKVGNFFESLLVDVCNMFMRFGGNGLFARGPFQSLFMVKLRFPEHIIHIII